MKNPIFLALDVDSKETALSLVEETKDFIGGYKIGPRLILKYGSEIIQKIAEAGEVFVDCKFYDIPNTMVESVRSAFEAGATYCTVHAHSGEPALKKLAELEAELSRKRPFFILAVTILTSFDQKSLSAVQNQKTIEEQVSVLANECQNAGIKGLVCSAQEVANLRSQFPDHFIVTPGIRLPEDSSGDQKRVVSPQDALKAGASALVVGRPIVEANSPKEAAKRYYESLNL